VYLHISLLAEYGLLFTIHDGQLKRPYVPYDRIHIDVEFAGRQPDEEPAPA
jgi:predicted transcriptional regulator